MTWKPRLLLVQLVVVENSGPGPGPTIAATGRGTNSLTSGHRRELLCRDGAGRFPGLETAYCTYTYIT